MLSCQPLYLLSALLLHLYLICTRMSRTFKASCETSTSKLCRAYGSNKYTKVGSYIGQQGTPGQQRQGQQQAPEKTLVYTASASVADQTCVLHIIQSKLGARRSSRPAGDMSKTWKPKPAGSCSKGTLWPVTCNFLPALHTQVPLLRWRSTPIQISTSA